MQVPIPSWTIVISCKYCLLCPWEHSVVILFLQIKKQRLDYLRPIFAKKFDNLRSFRKFVILKNRKKHLIEWNFFHPLVIYVLYMPWWVKISQILCWFLKSRDLYPHFLRQSKPSGDLCVKALLNMTLILRRYSYQKFEFFPAVFDYVLGVNNTAKLDSSVSMTTQNRGDTCQ